MISREKYKDILEKIPICCVDLLIHEGKKILLIKRNEEPEKNKWALIGGRIHKKESLIGAVKRKAIEEIGCEIEIEKFLGVYETIFDKGSFEDLKTGIHTINITYLARLNNPKEEIKVDSTSSEYKWFETIDKDVAIAVQKVIKDSKILD
ncbi:MAG TPA: NUDIX domain-containing protein [Candidatus Nanoarchaeia archaeon]|nr:NUDIX domain-containing protein [Candidatus Nanoarchaeia archaeon]